MTRRTTALSMVVAMIAVGCGQANGSATTTTPPPATESQIEVFCERHQEVRNLDYHAKYTALLDVAPAELDGPLFRMVNNPGPTDDDAKVLAFINEHCEA